MTLLNIDLVSFEVRRNLHKEDFHNVYFIPGAMRMLKSISLICVPHVAWREEKSVQRFGINT